jgi:hypothetical protein
MKSILWTEPTQTYTPQQPQQILITGDQPQNPSTGPHLQSTTPFNEVEDGSGPMKKGNTPPPPPPPPKAGVGANVFQKAATAVSTQATPKTTSDSRPDLGGLGDALQQGKSGLRKVGNTPSPQQVQSNLPKKEKTLAENLADALAQHRINMREDANDEGESDDEDWD